MNGTEKQIAWATDIKSVAVAFTDAAITWAEAMKTGKIELRENERSEDQNSLVKGIVASVDSEAADRLVHKSDRRRVLFDMAPNELETPGLLATVRANLDKHEDAQFWIDSRSEIAEYGTVGFYRINLEFAWQSDEIADGKAEIKRPTHKEMREIYQALDLVDDAAVIDHIASAVSKNGPLILDQILDERPYRSSISGTEAARRLRANEFRTGDSKRFVDGLRWIVNSDDCEMKRLKPEGRRDAIRIGVMHYIALSLIQGENLTKRVV